MRERGGLPWWVDEAVLVVEGFEKPEDGDEHDDVASQHQPTNSRRNLKQKDFDKYKLSITDMHVIWLIIDDKSWYI